MRRHDERDAVEDELATVMLGDAGCGERADGVTTS
jgi:hypothetical protein